MQGSAFPKSKTRHDFKSSFLFSVMSVIFFPLRSSWWIRKTSVQCYFVGCLIFFSFLMNLYWYQYFLCSEGTDVLFNHEHISKLAIFKIFVLSRVKTQKNHFLSSLLVLFFLCFQDWTHVIR